MLEDGSNPIYPEPYHVQLLGDGVLMALNPKVLAPSTRPGRLLSLRGPVRLMSCT